MLPKEAVVLDLADLHRQGEAILAQARDRAAQIIAQGTAERERLIKDAAAVGRAQGHAEGLAAGRAEGLAAGRAEALSEQRELLVKLAGAWTDALERFLNERERLIAEGRREVVRLAVAIAERVTKRTIAANPDVVVDQLAAVIELVSRPSRLRIAVHPADRATVEAALPGLAQAASAARDVELLDDPSLMRGSCVAKLADADPGNAASGRPAGSVNASIRTQLDRIVEALLPGEAPESDIATPVDRTVSPSEPQPPSQTLPPHQPPSPPPTDPDGAST